MWGPGPEVLARGHPRARAPRLLPCFPSLVLCLGEEQAGFEACHQSSLGAEATELTAGCQVSSSSHLRLEMRL